MPTSKCPPPCLYPTSSCSPSSRPFPPCLLTSQLDHWPLPMNVYLAPVHSFASITRQTVWSSAHWKYFPLLPTVFQGNRWMWQSCSHCLFLSSTHIPSWPISKLSLVTIFIFQWTASCTQLYDSVCLSDRTHSNRKFFICCDLMLMQTFYLNQGLVTCHVSQNMFIQRYIILCCTWHGFSPEAGNHFAIL